MKTPTRAARPQIQRHHTGVRHRLGPLSIKIRSERRGLPPQALDELHPNHLVLSATGSVLQFGPGLAALLPSLRTGDRAERFFIFRQTDPSLPARSDTLVRISELPVHDGFEVMAGPESPDTPTFQLRFRVHFLETSKEIWLFDTAQPVLGESQSRGRRTPLEPDARSRLESDGVLDAPRRTYFEALNAVASGLSHEMNNLMMGILGNTELLGLSIEEPSTRQRQMIDAIRDNADRAAELCDQLLLFSGKRPAVKEEIDASRFLDTLSVGEFSPTLDPTVTVRLEMKQPGPRLFGDVVQLRQVARELIRNAIEASDPRGTVTVRLSEVSPTHDQESFEQSGSSHRTTVSAIDPELLDESDCRFTVLEVVDRGHGMTSSTLERALEPFFSTRFLGRGLGLPAVLGIARAHGGAVTIESEPDRGTRVRVTLPQRIHELQDAERQGTGGR